MAAGGQAAVIVLTGGIASGKSTVSRLYESQGVAVVDTDQLAREVVMSGEPGLKRLVEAFGADILDMEGNLNRRSLRRAVFADEGARNQLNAILHPLIMERAWQQINRLNEVFVVLVVPLYVETGCQPPAEAVIVVDLPASLQISRLLERDGIDEQLARSMLDAQASRQARLDIADYVIDNSGTLEELRSNAMEVLSLIRDNFSGSSKTRPKAQ